MLRFVIVILAIALYGGYSLVGSLSGSGKQEETAQPASSGFSLGSAAEMAVSAATRTAGLSLVPLPSEGCSDSIMPAAAVEALVLALPEPQRTALATVLNASSTVWTAQLYKGEQGVGLCLPVHDRLIVLPASVNSTVDQFGAAVAPLKDGLSFTKESE
ncbi:hypothetical protein WJ96_07355 [Burkholderia ubonensis]|uniref:Uncharacterized protein n=1 Tax=Burkholderia ubonensis TaxID=101571 RepID=A0AAW3MRV4_9BURK|nr:hypothetical protein [Burkholderia ubonensis]KVP75515.1 hypothetical protein WJ93_09145 [Burkholderia ubonensis]KVP98329.1 hypothetical protein WJ96_07355 [Burkholderia ubonensis]KVZ93027.1 hypothetical protein WL25_19015 [Burkholderia ubonensis]